jgi:hypothetical protein
VTYVPAMLLVTNCKPIRTSAPKLHERSLTFVRHQSLMNDGHQRRMASSKWFFSSNSGPALDADPGWTRFFEANGRGD